MSDRYHVPVIGLVGGVGSGKSSVAKWVASKRNIVVVDGDRVGHQVLKQTVTKQKIRQRFGDDVFDADGEVSRKKLAEIVFGPSPEQQQARIDLEQITHPQIKEVFRGTIADAATSLTSEAVVLDAAVLLEAGWEEMCDAVVFVYTPLETRMQRVRDNRGWSEAELSQREASQLSLESKRSRADFVISNTADIAAAGKQLEQQLNQIIDQHPRRPAGD